MTDLEVVVAHAERATVRIGGTFLKMDADAAAPGAEVDVLLAAS